MSFVFFPTSTYITYQLPFGVLFKYYSWYCWSLNAFCWEKQNSYRVAFFQVGLGIRDWADERLDVNKWIKTSFAWSPMLSMTLKSWCVITLVYCSYLCIYIFSTVWSNYIINVRRIAAWNIAPGFSLPLWHQSRLVETKNGKTPKFLLKF
jgi:hypothetical protein